MLGSELAGRDIAILGAGREGRSALSWLRRQFPDTPLTVYDERAVSLEPDPLTTVVEGPLEAERLRKHDVLIRSPGISPYRPALRLARAAGVRCTSASSLWFAAHPQLNTICITGTKGKSTTAALTAHLLKAAGLRVQLAGNIGTPLLDCPDDAADWWVIELSSYQLADLEARPSLAAILNVSDEHLDWHGGAAAYRRDKLRLAELAAGAPLILNFSDRLLLAEFSQDENVRWFGHAEGWHVLENELYFGSQALPDLPRNRLPGPHNLENLAAALTLLQAAGISGLDLRPALTDFKGLPHRLQYLGTVGGVEFVNDSLATTPVATVAALEAYRGRPVILLIGGLDRGLDWTQPLARMQGLCPQAVICLPDSGAGLAAAMAAAGLLPGRGIHGVPDLEAGMRRVAGLSRTGDVVLLSPGAPSFPHFRDYAERGERFAAAAGINNEKETAGLG